MTLEELQDIVEKKLKINDTELDLEALKTPQLHNEFLKHYNKFKLMKTKASAELATIKLHKWEYYTVNRPYISTKTIQSKNSKTRCRQVY